MPDRGVNAVEPETSIVDAVLTPRLAARFARALALDENGGDRRAPKRERDQRLGPGLFELAMATRRAAPALATTAAVVDAASRRALANAAFACGAEMIATIAEAGDAAVPTDAAGEARLVRASTLPMAALLDEAIAATAEIATRIGDDAALAWFVATARRVDPRVASVALGVIASVPATAASEPSFGQRLARAHERIAAQRRAIARAAELRASRADAIEAAQTAARTATTAAIAGELAARLREIETTRVRDLAAVDRWYTRELPLRVADAYVGRDAALAAAERARREAIDAAHDERVAAIAARHEHDATDAARARWERELESIDRIEEPALRQRLAQRVRDERDRAFARAEADDTTERARQTARYDARVAEAERTYARAVSAAEAAPLEAEQALMRAAAARRAAIEATAAAASRDAHELADARGAREVDEAATAAARARAAQIDDELAALDRVARGGAHD